MPIILSFSNKPYYIDVHLSRQHYKACIRKNSGKAYICYIGCTTIVGSATASADKSVILQVRVGVFLIISSLMNNKALYSYMIS